MHDTLSDDVDALLLKGIGDKRILQQIKRAAENGEVISINERNYVASLKAVHAGKRARPEPAVPSVVGDATTGPATQKVVFSSPPPRPEPGRRRRATQQTKVIAGIGVIALAAALVGGVFFADIEFGGGGGGGIADPVQPAPAISLSTDVQSYVLGDIISISGQSDVSLGDRARLSIQNADDDLIWTEDVSLKSDGVFSTLTIAGGYGWEDAGTYTLTVEHGGETGNSSFAFRGQ